MKVELPADVRAQIIAGVAAALVSAWRLEQLPHQECHRATPVPSTSNARVGDAHP